MASSGYTLSLSVAVALGAVGSGYYLSQRQKQAREKPEAGVEVPLSKVSSVSVEEYCQARNKPTSDYAAVRVRGCPAQAPAEVVKTIEAVVEYRNCSGIGLIPKADAP